MGFQSILFNSKAILLLLCLLKFNFTHDCYSLSYFRFSQCGWWMFIECWSVNYGSFMIFVNFTLYRKCLHFLSKRVVADVLWIFEISLWGVFGFELLSLSSEKARVIKILGDLFDGLHLSPCVTIFLCSFSFGSKPKILCSIIFDGSAFTGEVLLRCALKKIPSSIIVETSWLRLGTCKYFQLSKVEKLKFISMLYRFPLTTDI